MKLDRHSSLSPRIVKIMQYVTWYIQEKFAVH